MKLLALDTSSLACSVGVMHDADIVLRHEEKAREHTRLLMPMIRSALAEAELELTGLDAIVLGNGPGSFIGMRIAASVAQGLAHGAGLDIVPVSSMAAVAAAAAQSGFVAVAQDAHMQQVYLGIYEIDDAGQPTPVFTERLQACERIADLEGLPKCTAAGFGWERYPDLLAANEGQLDSLSTVQHPCARELLALGQHALERGGSIRPEAVDPAYLRQKVAEKPVSAGS